MSGTDIGLNAALAKHNAKAKNHVWAWGGKRKDGSIVLVVWGGGGNQPTPEQIRPGVFRVNVLEPGDTDRSGGAERVEHLAAIAAGTPGFALFAVHVDLVGGKIPDGSRVKSINADVLFIIDEVLPEDADGITYAIVRHPKAPK